MDETPHRRTGVGAGVRLKQKLAQLLVRSSCTTNATKITTTPATAFVSLDKANTHPCQEPRHSPDLCTHCTYKRPNLMEGSRSRRHRRRSASVVHASIDNPGQVSGRRSVHSNVPLLPQSLQTSDAKKQTKKSMRARSTSVSRRHGSYSSCRRPRMNSVPYSCSSSTATDDESGADAETTTLFSSLSFSSDSASEFYHTNSSNASRKSHGNAPRRTTRRALPSARGPPDAFRQRVNLATKDHHCKNSKRDEGANAIKKMGVEETGAIGVGMAVVKRSSNPYADFRSSMVEMVVERRIASVGKMEELLESYLSLNSLEHHPAIIAAFEDVWEAVFSEA
ncbi:transcription repressor OFP8-like [Hordeum vulgare subsp. vulgare]|uniref:Transcription repressor n=1 Tax=Hordeum vulgare subsp. vulgare TaxID=112509 RepID=A0A8I6XUX5_HORVV|nr:transcription repressor OFP8-like [Hordeum vulgare subsp. vulgare]